MSERFPIYVVLALVGTIVAVQLVAPYVILPIFAAMFGIHEIQ